MLQFIINIDRATVVTNPSKTSIQYKNVLINIGDNLSIVAKIQKKIDLIDNQVIYLKK